MLSRGKVDALEQFVDEALHVDPSSADVLLLHAKLRAYQKRSGEALDDLKTVLSATVAAADFESATRVLLDAAQLAPDLDPKMVAGYYAGLAHHESAIPLVASYLETLRGSPMYIRLRQLCREPLRARLFGAARSEAPDRDALPAELGSALPEWATVPAIQRAIDMSDERRFTLLRNACAHLTRPQRRALADAIGRRIDISYARLINSSSLQGAAVVDASNVAMYEMDMMPTHKPLIASIDAVRHTLYEHGYFPVIIVADANLPHVIDDPERLKRMRDNGEVQVVHRGTQADEFIVQEAKRIGALIVSNDRMIEHDADLVPKARFDIGMTDGRATVHF
jgi:hypothetical protein